MKFLSYIFLMLSTGCVPESQKDMSGIDTYLADLPGKLIQKYQVKKARLKHQAAGKHKSPPDEYFDILYWSMDEKAVKEAIREEFLKNYEQEYIEKINTYVNSRIYMKILKSNVEYFNWVLVNEKIPDADFSSERLAACNEAYFLSKSDETSLQVADTLDIEALKAAFIKYGIDRRFRSQAEMENFLKIGRKRRKADLEDQRKNRQVPFEELAVICNELKKLSLQDFEVLLKNAKEPWFQYLNRNIDIGTAKGVNKNTWLLAKSR